MSIWCLFFFFFFFSSRRRHTRLQGDWSSDVCSSDLGICCTTSGWASTCTRSFWGADACMEGGRAERAGDADLGKAPSAGRKTKGYRCFPQLELTHKRSEERRVGKECRSRWSPYH